MEHDTHVKIRSQLQMLESHARFGLPGEEDRNHTRPQKQLLRELNREKKVESIGIYLSCMMAELLRQK